MRRIFDWEIPRDLLQQNAKFLSYQSRRVKLPRKYIVSKAWDGGENGGVSSLHRKNPKCTLIYPQTGNLPSWLQNAFSFPFLTFPFFSWSKVRTINSARQADCYTIFIKYERMLYKTSSTISSVQHSWKNYLTVKLNKLQKGCTKLLCLRLNELCPCTLFCPICSSKCFYWFVVHIHLKTFCVCALSRPTNKGNREQKPITKKLAEFHNQFALLTMVAI